MELAIGTKVFWEPEPGREIYGEVIGYTEESGVWGPWEVALEAPVPYATEPNGVITCARTHELYLA